MSIIHKCHTEHQVSACLLLIQVMTRREELLFHQEMKFRNKLVEYLTDWVLLFDDKRQHLPLDLTVLSKYDHSLSLCFVVVVCLFVSVV